MEGKRVSSAEDAPVCEAPIFDFNHSSLLKAFYERLLAAEKLKMVALGATANPWNGDKAHA